MSMKLSVINSETNSIENDNSNKQFLIKSIYEFSNDSIVILNEKKQITQYSKKFHELFNYEHILGESFVNLINNITQLPNDFFKEKSYFLNIKKENSQQIFKANIIKNENQIDNNIRYIIILKNINEQEEIQAQKDNFIATLTHDLKTPVRADILSLELLLKGRFGELNPEQTEIIQELLNSNKFMMNMLDTLLAKYKYESSEVQLNKTEFELNEFIKKCAKELRCIFDERKVICNITSKEEYINIIADKIELKRAISNLITNAIKFNRPNGCVNISTQKENNKIKIIVEDTGIGMDKEKIKYIFDRYISYAKRFRQLGTGLGLYVAKKIIEAHQGKIEVSSIEKKGSIFTITLPIE